MRSVKDVPRRTTAEVVISRLPLGQLIPGTRYRVRAKLGEGAMGEVYLAEHVDLEKKVALKLLNSIFARQPDSVERFRQEARAASKIGNPYICDVTDFGYTPDGRVFFIMEYLDGRSLRAVLHAEGALPSARVIGILRQTCKALGAAHDKGIIHLDVKPDNVMVRDVPPRTDLVKMVDFGIAGLLSDQTRQDVISGTPEYIAPERALGRGYGHRSDIYSLGVLSYELLTGTTPFAADDVTALLHKHVEEEPQSLRQRAPDRNIPPDLETVILQMMQKDPSARPQNMAVVEAMLCEAQIAAALTTPWDDLELPQVDAQWRAKLADRMPSPRGRQRKMIALGATVVAGVAISIALYLGLIRGETVREVMVPVEVTKTEEIAAVGELLRKAENAARALRYTIPANDSALSYLEAAEAEALRSAPNGKSPGALLLRGAYADALALAGAELKKNDLPDLAALKFKEALKFRPDDADLHAKAELSAEERRAYLERAKARSDRQAAPVAVSVKGPSRDDEAKQAAANIYLAANKGMFSEARLAQKKLATFDASGVQSAKLADALRKAAGTAWAGGKYTEARAYYQLVSDLDPKDMEAKERLGADAIPTVAPPPTIYDGSIGTGKSKQKDEALVDGARQSAASRPYAMAGLAALNKGKLAEAEMAFSRSLRLDHANSVAIAGLAEVAFERGRYTEALDYGRAASRMAPKSPRYLMIVGDAYFKLLRYQEAYDVYKRAAKLNPDDEEITGRLKRAATKLGLE
jgi:tetratricopeptide (TPR) repeat protein